jgi:hypothetical protein
MQTFTTKRVACEIRCSVGVRGTTWNSRSKDEPIVFCKCQPIFITKWLSFWHSERLYERPKQHSVAKCRFTLLLSRRLQALSCAPNYSQELRD